MASRRCSMVRLVSTTRRSMISLQRVAHHRLSERGTPHSSSINRSSRGGALLPLMRLPLPLPLQLPCRASRRSVSSLPDVCGLPVVTSSWKAIKSLDEAYTEVKGEASSLTGLPGLSRCSLLLLLLLLFDQCCCACASRNTPCTYGAMVSVGILAV